MTDDFILDKQRRQDLFKGTPFSRREEVKKRVKGVRSRIGKGAKFIGRGVKQSIEGLSQLPEKQRQKRLLGLKAHAKELRLVKNIEREKAQIRKLQRKARPQKRKKEREELSPFEQMRMF